MESPRTVVLVEGESDRLALHAAAGLSGRDLPAEGVEVVAMGGITNLRAFATRLGPHGLGVPLAGLYDAPEEAIVRRGLAAAGLPTLGFFACLADLEDELIRALGMDAVEDVIEAAGEMRSLGLLARMPAQRGWPREAVLRRFLTSQSGRKSRYATLFVEALEPGQVPAPIASLLSWVLPPGMAGCGA